MGNLVETSGGANIQGNANTAGGDFVNRDKLEFGRQEQQAGDESINIQAHLVTIHSGLSYVEVREIALDIFHQNFYRLSGVAASIASERAKEITDAFLKNLVQQNPAGIQQAEDPDFQHSLFIAQREYARSGDRELADLLVDLLVDRTREDVRSLQSIVLNESLSVVSNLTSDQIAVLTLVFVLRYVQRLGINGHAALVHHVRQVIPWISLLPEKNSAYQHLEFMRCCSVQIGEIKIAKLFLSAYPGLFCKGFSHEQLVEIAVSFNDLHKLVIPCLNRNDFLQLNAVDSSSFRDLAEQQGLKPDVVAKLIELQESNLMSEEEATDLLQSIDPDLATLIKVWDHSTLKHITLSSVGVAIGHANHRRLTGNTAPLSIWI